MKGTALLIVVLLGAVMVWGSLDLPHLGDANSAPSTHVVPRYIERAYDETRSRNMVTAVLADYRSFDTLGEAAVIFSAAVACLLILGTGAGGGEKQR